MYTHETVKDKDVSFYYINQHGDLVYSNSGCSIIGFSSRESNPEWFYVKNLNES